MTIQEYINEQPEERRKLLQAIHEAIMKKDDTVTAAIGTMMSKQMILYNEGKVFKYGLASVKNHMSLHMMPIYGSAELHGKYEQLLPDATFQKGCINFKTEAEMPMPVVSKLLSDCAKVSMVAMMAMWDQKRKKK